MLKVSEATPILDTTSQTLQGVLGVPVVKHDTTVEVALRSVAKYVAQEPNARLLKWDMSDDTDIGGESCFGDPDSRYQSSTGLVKRAVQSS